ncbi:methylated-DNA--[protein]-cysteine S-methyltransferase [Aquimarina sp. W85]|uniref:methylated-DNA--[protein]-cysteine S-methyltransferase n=1 Tax=Aquimarina rhodophyticola TaxID=3342246 RepID=UPI0036732615
MKTNQISKVYKVTFKTPLGIACLLGDELGLTVCTLNELETSDSCKDSLPAYFGQAIQQLHEYFEGIRKKFTIPIHPQGTDFQLKVWNQLLTIPYGKTASYLDIAKQLGDPKVIRAAASANGKNPLWIIIPCHRVIGSDGSLTGYAGGLWRKKWLLDHENPSKQQLLF